MRIFVRHGAYRESKRDDSEILGDLLPKGKAQIKEISEQLYSITQGKTIVILSSPAARAKQSANIIKEKLGMKHDFQIHQMLDVDADSEPVEIHALLEKQTTQVTIVVSHENVIRKYCEKQFQTFFESPILSCGEALILGWPDKAVKRLKLAT